MVAYEAKFHGLSIYATQLVTTKEDMIWLFIKGLNSELQLFRSHDFCRKELRWSGWYFKKVEGVKRNSQAKVLTKRA